MHLPQVVEGKRLLLAFAASASRIRLWAVCRSSYSCKNLIRLNGRANSGSAKFFYVFVEHSLLGPPCGRRLLVARHPCGLPRALAWFRLRRSSPCLLESPGQCPRELS